MNKNLVFCFCVMLLLVWSLAVFAAPSASNAKVLPENPTAGHDLYCNYNYSSPVSENYTEQGSIYEWWKNGVNQNINSQKLSKGNLTLNDEWSCKVTPSDGLNNGSTIQSTNNVTIVSTAQNPAMYVGSNQTWNANGYYSDVQRVIDFNDELASALDTCTADAEGYCNVSLNFSSSAIGLLNVTDLEIYYELTVVSLEITGLSAILSNGTVKVFELVIKNNGTSSVSNVTWKINLGDGTIVNSSYSTSLATGETMPVYIHYNYNNEGDYTVTANATAIAAVDTITATSSIPVHVGNLDVSNFSVINSSGTGRTFEAYVKNYMAVSMTNVSWSLNTGNGVVSSSSPIILQSQGSAFVFVQYNYTSAGTFAANFTAVNGSWNDLEALNVTIT